MRVEKTIHWLPSFKDSALFNLQSISRYGSQSKSQEEAMSEFFFILISAVWKLSVKVTKKRSAHEMATFLNNKQGILKHCGNTASLKSSMTYNKSFRLTDR